jgi:hypothetical protein
MIGTAKKAKVVGDKANNMVGKWWYKQAWPTSLGLMPDWCWCARLAAAGWSLLAERFVGGGGELIGDWCGAAVVVWRDLVADVRLVAESRLLHLSGLDEEPIGGVSCCWFVASRAVDWGRAYTILDLSLSVSSYLRLVSLLLVLSDLVL